MSNTKSIAPSLAQLIASSLTDHLVTIEEAVSIVDKVTDDAKIDAYERSAVRQYNNLIFPYDTNYPPRRQNYFRSLDEAQQVWALLQGVLTAEKPK